MPLRVSWPGTRTPAVTPRIVGQRCVKNAVQVTDRRRPQTVVTESGWIRARPAGGPVAIGEPSRWPPERASPGVPDAPSDDGAILAVAACHVIYTIFGDESPVTGR